MNTTFKKLCLAAALTAGSSAVIASPINVGGVVWDPDAITDLTSTGDVYQSVTIITGDTISGYGELSKFNDKNPIEFDGTGFCQSGCELTYEFGGYTLQNIDADGDYGFSGGWLNVYVDDLTAPGAESFDSTSLSSATGGQVFLELVGHSVYNTELNDGFTFSTLMGSLTVLPDGVDFSEIAGAGFGFFDVVGGIAAANFDTNGENDGADIQFDATFTPIAADQIANYPAFVTHSGDVGIKGDTIPEPSTIALFGLTLLGLGLARRKAKS